mmetsp:Transcript_7113/g.24891  ORF Transcript_7113/g.24891 Transcript_7113/m.24891 type:complete len:280 (+) Transcript_7113:232-1071(+)
MARMSAWHLRPRDICTGKVWRPAWVAARGGRDGGRGGGGSGGGRGGLRYLPRRPLGRGGAVAVLCAAVRGARSSVIAAPAPLRAGRGATGSRRLRAAGCGRAPACPKRCGAAGCRPTRPASCHRARRSQLEHFDGRTHLESEAAPQSAPPTLPRRRSRRSRRSPGAPRGPCAIFHSSVNAVVARPTRPSERHRGPQSPPAPARGRAARGTRGAGRSARARPRFPHSRQTYKPRGILNHENPSNPMWTVAFQMGPQTAGVIPCLGFDVSNVGCWWDACHT